MFPHAPEPFIDLSTGINPYPYKVPPLAPALFERLPDGCALERLAAAAVNAYGAPSPACVVVAPGTQVLLPLVAALASAGRAAILGPTYAEHARAAALAGHQVEETHDAGRLSEADLAIVVNPNNPDGRVFKKDKLLAVADEMRRRAGLLVIDEAFMDVGPLESSLASETLRGGIVVLRSFGKFFGLAGLRLGFALAAPDIAARLRASLGPWAVSGPAIAIGEAALADFAWIAATRALLARQTRRLDELLLRGGLDVVGGTALFRLAQTQAAPALFDKLGRAGILVRRFAAYPAWLRFGLPADDAAWRRLALALS
jgi:cobalamin biosynthetic protein CobC